MMPDNIRWSRLNNQIPYKEGATNFFAQRFTFPFQSFLFPPLDPDGELSRSSAVEDCDIESVSSSSDDLAVCSDLDIDRRVDVEFRRSGTCLKTPGSDIFRTGVGRAVRPAKEVIILKGDVAGGW